LTRAALLANPKVSSYQYFLRSAEATAPSLGIDLADSPVETAADIERAIEELARRPNSGLILPPDASTIVHRDLIVALAAQHRLPAVYALKAFVVAGGLMSYGTDQNDLFRLAASYVDRILRGDKPADLPVQAPTRFETTVNGIGRQTMTMDSAGMIQNDAIFFIWCSPQSPPDHLAIQQQGFCWAHQNDAAQIREIKSFSQNLAVANKLSFAGGQARHDVRF